MLNLIYGYAKNQFLILKKEKEALIIIVSSIAGLQGVKNLGAYSISKTADIGLNKKLSSRIRKV